MKRRTKQTPRWSDHKLTREIAGRYTETERVNDPRRSDAPAGLGPYESQYDVSLGYGQDRSILLP
jgi:hypothetical protein